MEMIKVRIKTWEEMEKEFGRYLDGVDEVETYINLNTFFWHTELERIMPKDRIIEVKAKNELGEHYMVGQYYGISDDAIAEYIEKTQDEDYIENLEFENRMFAEFLESLGYSNGQISDISMMGARFNQTNSGD